MKDLKQWEAGRRFGGHREEEEKKKLRAAYEVAMEKAYMRQRYESEIYWCGVDLSLTCVVTGNREERQLQVSSP